jgi:hypothetical protein
VKHHLLAFYANQAISATDAILNAVTDSYFSIQNNQFQVPVPLRILAGAYIGAAHTSRARVNTPSLRLKGFPQIVPSNQGANFSSNPGVADWTEFPVMAAREENIEVDSTNASGAATDKQCAFLWVTSDNLDLNINYPDIRWIRATATPTVIANGWSGGYALALQDVIQGGVYNILGMQCQAASAIAARLILQNQYYRPGCLIKQNLYDVPHRLFNGNMGIWGQFTTYVLPQIETFGLTAGADAVDVDLLVAYAGQGSGT